MNTALVLVQRQSMQVYMPDFSTPVSIMIPENVMKDMEIVDEAGLLSLLKTQSVFTKTPVNIVLLMGDDVCFFQPTEADKEEEAKRTLMAQTPFSHIAETVLKNDKSIMCVTTNADLYEGVSRAFVAMKLSVLGVYPWYVLAFSSIVKSGEVFDTAAVKRFFESMTSIKAFAFKSAATAPEKVVAKTPQAATTPPKKKTGWIIFIVLALVYAAIMLVVVMRQ